MATTTITIENETDTNLTISVTLSPSNIPFDYADAKSGSHPGRCALAFAPPGESKNLTVAHKANGAAIPCGVKVKDKNKTVVITQDANGHFLFDEK